MYKAFKISAVCIGVLVFMGCKQRQETNYLPNLQSTIAEEPIALVDNVMTQQEQIALSPDEVIQSLKDGNTRFMNDELTARNYSKQVINSASGQYPDAVVLSCLDSRIPVENVFDRGIDDLFVAVWLETL